MIAMSAIEPPNRAKDHPLHPDDSSDGITKPHVAASDQEVEKRDSAGTVQEQPLRRYWVRPLVAVLVPSIVTAYYGVIWVYLIHGTVYDEVVNYRTFSGSLIFYSWFIIGVFGLSWSKYGLVGVEASMLRTRFWSAPNLVALLKHSNGTWSSPSGWLNAIIERQCSRLWGLLTFISFLPYIALPLSGLVFEIADGYIKTSDPASVVGRNESTFNQVYPTEAQGANLAKMSWQLGPTLDLPGFGVIYTNESVDRSEHPNLGELPNTFPLNGSIPDLFLAPQADRPVSGEAWGLRIKYDCSTVRSTSQLTVLRKKTASTIVSTECPSGTDTSLNCIELEGPSKDKIGLFHITQFNIWGYYEMAVGNTSMTRWDRNHPDFDAEEGETSRVLEYLAWQYRVNPDLSDDKFPFDNTTWPSIEGLGNLFVKSDGNYAENQSLLDLYDDLVATPGKNLTTDIRKVLGFNGDEDRSGSTIILDVAVPAGVRCVTSSGLGFAELDGLTSTFRNFRRADPKVHAYVPVGTFGLNAESMMWGQYYQHFASSGLSDRRPAEISPRYPAFLDPESLLRSVNLAYAMDAYDLMYGRSTGYKMWWDSPSLTSSREGKILAVASLIENDGVGYFVLGLFILWAALSAGLSLFYGFRRRPADRLDGYTILRKGADLSEELKGNEEFMSGKPVKDSKTLKAFPGS